MRTPRIIPNAGSTITGSTITGSTITVAVLALSVVFSTARSEDAEFMLIENDLTSRRVRIASLDDDTLAIASVDDPSGRPRIISRDGCLAIVRLDDDESVTELTQTRRRAVRTTAHSGLLELSDGQRLPGSIAARIPENGSIVVWTHPWLGPLDISIDDVAMAIFEPGFQVPEAGAGDVLVLRNGDRLEGFIDRLGDPITIEVEGETESSVVEVPLERAAAVRLVPPPRQSDQIRVWFADGTVLDVPRVGIGADGFLRIWTPGRPTSEAPLPIRLDDLSAILLEPGTLLPLASIDPIGIESSRLRYLVPPPQSTDRRAPMGVSPIVLRGPIVARYRLPIGCVRFAAEVSLPADARTWGDLDFVVRSERREVFRAHLDHSTPRASVNVPIGGRRLEIELTAGERGSIQDRVLIERALLRVK